MKEQFLNSPLVELIAEIRWETGLPKNALVMPGHGLEVHEEFFNRLKELVAVHGYLSSERLSPSGYPFPLANPVWRFKKSSVASAPSERAKELASVLQVGAGFFSINALQPYSTWYDFVKVLKAGVDSLLESEPCMKNSGYSLTLKYLNAFGESYLESTDLRSFLEKYLDIKLNLPEAITKHSINDSSETPLLHIKTPIKIGSLNILFAEGNVRNEDSLIMENSVVVDTQFESDSAQIVEAFSHSRDVIHDVFISLTKKLHDKMKFVDEEK
jgi:uncharacterized protein (TIGR04255 family)